MKTYVLEWSKKQNAFHVQPLDASLSRNQVAFLGDERTGDYIVLMVGSQDVCHAMADNHRKTLERRSETRPEKAYI